MVKGKGYLLKLEVEVAHGRLERSHLVKG